MKNTLLLVCFLLIITGTVCAQQPVHFKVHYIPETQYHQNISQSITTKLSYSGPADKMQQLADKGIQNPVVTKKKSDSEIDFKTGRLQQNNKFPVTMTFLKTVYSDGKKIIPEGTVVYGQGTADNLPVLDSIASDEMEADFKKAVLQIVQSTFSQISFPEKKVRVGKSFTHKMPLSIPLIIPGSTLDLNIVTTYKLVGIRGHLADFDIVQEYTMTSDIAQNSITATGTGNGQLIYDINNSFLLHYETENNLDMNMEVQGVLISVQLQTGYRQQVEIFKN